MCQQVMVEGGWRAPPLGAIAAHALMVTGIVQSLMYDAPLHSSVVVVVHGHILLATPSEAAVVNDNLLCVLNTYGATLYKAALPVGSVRLAFLSWQFLGAQTRAEVTYNDILRPAQVQLAATQQDALTGSRLPCYGDVLQLGTYGTLVLALGVGADVYNARDAEHDGGILPSGLCQCPPQRALALVVQIGYLYHLAASSAGGILAKALGRGEGQRAVLRKATYGHEGHHCSH